MLSVLLAAALWINLATIMSAPVSTTHSIDGGVLGARIAGAVIGLVDWVTAVKIAASWVILPVLDADFAAGILYLYKNKDLFRRGPSRGGGSLGPYSDCRYGSRVRCLHVHKRTKENLETVSC